jgi:hypothetical protein
MSINSSLGYIQDELILRSEIYASVNGFDTPGTYATVSDAYLAGNRNILVSVDTTETVAITLAANENLTLIVESDVTLTVAVGSVWLTGNLSEINISGGTISSSIAMFAETANSTVHLHDCALTLTAVISICDVQRVLMNNVIVTGSATSLLQTTNGERFWIHDCTFAQALTLTTLGSTAHSEFSGCVFTGPVTLSITGGLFTACHFLSTIGGVTSNGMDVTNCHIVGAATFTGTTLNCNYTNTHFASSLSLQVVQYTSIVGVYINGTFAVTGNALNFMCSSTSFNSSVTFSGAYADSTFNGCVVGTTADFGTSATTSAITGNSIVAFTVDTTNDTCITGNRCPTLAITTAAIDTVILGNTCSGAITLQSLATSTVNSNVFASLTVTTTASTSSITGNTTAGTIVITGEAAQMVITGNKSTGISSGASTSANNVVVGNSVIGGAVGTLTGTVANNQT